MREPTRPDKNEPSDSELVRACATDRAASDRLYRRYAGQVFRYVHSRSPSAEDAADLTQDVFLRCFQALPRYDDRGVPFRVWLFRIARNVAIDAARRRRPWVSWERLTPEFLSRSTPSGFATPDSGETMDLDELIARLPAEKQDLLALRYAAGRSIAEIALIRGMSEAAVRKQLQRIVYGLREQVDRE